MAGSLGRGASVQFSDLQPISVPLGQLAGTVSGDFTGDGRVDIIALHRRGEGSILAEGLATGGFSEPRRRPIATPHINGAIAGDVSGNGHLDLVIATRVAGEELHFLEGRGDGTFAQPLALANSLEFNGAPRLVDLNQDGLLDILATGEGLFGARPTLYQNLGGGTFAEGRFLIADAATDARLLDVDGDGDQDLAAMQSSGNQVYVFENLGNGDFGPRQDFVVTTDAPAVRTLVSDASLGAVPYGLLAEVVWAQVPGMRDVAAIDLDGDGGLDIVGAGETGELYVAVTRGFTDRSFPVPLGVEAGTFLQACDLDSDGDQDLVTVNARLGPVFLENTGDGTLTERVLVPGASSFRQRLEVEDMNGDGRLDIVGLDGNFNVVFVAQGPSGTFLPPTLVATLGERVDRVMVADVNGDATLDPAVVVNAPDGSMPTPRDLVWFEGVGGAAPSNQRDSCSAA